LARFSVVEEDIDTEAEELEDENAEAVDTIDDSGEDDNEVITDDTDLEEEATAESGDADTTNTDSISGEKNEKYEVLYRRFRPFKFSEILGQDHTVAALKKSVINGTVANVYLFEGERGTGKTSTARVFASALNCPNVRGGEPCGECTLCVSVHSGDGAEGVREIDAGSNSSVDDARRIINEVQFATRANKNVFIIDEVHLLSNAANSALLKTLEEPPADVVFILCTTNAERLQAAVRSRAVVFHFNSLDDKKMFSLIKKVAEEANISINDEQINGVIRKGKGSPRDALSALESVAGTDHEFDYENHAENITNKIVKQDIAGIVVAVAKAVEGGLPANEISSGLLAYWRTLLLVLNAPSLSQLSDSEFDRVSEIAEGLGTSKVIYMLRTLGEHHSKIAGEGGRVGLETLLIQFVIPVSEAGNIRDINAQLAELREMVRAITAIQPLGSIASPAKDSDWPPVGESVTKSEKSEDNSKKKDEDLKNDSSHKSPKKGIIKDPDELIEAIFEAGNRKLPIAIPSLEVDTKNTNDEILVLKSHKRITDAEFDMLHHAVEKVDPRDFELDESK